MKKQLLATLVAMLSAAALLLAAEAWKTYYSPAQGISIEYPESWALEDDPAMGIIVSVPADASGKAGNAIACYRLSKKKLSLEEAKKYFEEQKLDRNIFKINSVKTRKEKGGAVVVYEGSMTPDEQVYRMSASLADRQGIWCVTMYTAFPESFEQYQPVAEKVKASLSLKKDK